MLALLSGKRDGRPTAATDQMLMTGVFGQVVHRRTVTHVGVGEEPGPSSASRVRYTVERSRRVPLLARARS